MSMTTLQLKPFQEGEVAHILERKRSGVFWDMGLGKTAAASSVGARAGLQRWLIICPDNARSVWGGSKVLEQLSGVDWIREMFPEEIPTIKVEHIEGSPWNRDLQWDAPYQVYDPGMERPIVHIKIVTPGTWLKDWGDVAKGRSPKRKHVALRRRANYNIPQIVIFDECRGLRNKETQMFKAFQKWLTYYSVEYLLLMTGTPGHEPKHFWTLLNLINPRYFKSYWDFCGAFHRIDEGPFGMEVNEPINLGEWHRILKQYASVVREDDPGIAEQRPPITRQLLEITLDDDQSRLYKAFVKDMLVELDSGLVFAQNEFTVITRLRQTLVCPRIFSPELSVGAAIKDFADQRDPEEHNVIFTPYTSAQPFFKAYLDSKGFGHVYILKGAMGTPERDEALHAWRSTGGVVICSILYAQAFSLEPATRCFFIGYDWDPDNNRQAEKRLHRLTTQNPVVCYYYTYQSTFDHQLAATVNLKQQRVNQTMPPRELFLPST